MPIVYRSEIKGDYLHVVIAGSLCSAAEMVGYIDRIHKDLVQAGLTRVLADETNCLVHMKLSELGAALSSVQEPDELKTSSRKSAVVSSTINHLLCQHIFDRIECIRVFIDEEPARQWLTEG